MDLGRLKKAIKFSDLDAVNEYLNNGGKVNVFLYESVTPIRYALIYRHTYENQYDLKRSSVFTKTDDEILCRLIRAGADVNATDKCERTPLMDALYYKRSYKVIYRLIDAGSDINAVAPPELNTPLISAIEFNYNKKLITDLISRGADINYTNYFGRTPLFYALQNNYDLEVAMMLIDLGADLTVHDNCSMNLLMVIGCVNCSECYCKYKEVIDLLINNGVSLKEADMDGDTIVHNVNCNYLIDLCIGSGVSVNTKNSKGHTPLLSAMLCGNVEKVDNLLKLFHADLNSLLDPAYISNSDPDSLHLSELNKFVNLYFYYYCIDLLDCNETPVFALLVDTTFCQWSIKAIIKHFLMFVDENGFHNFFRDCSIDNCNYYEEYFFPIVERCKQELKKMQCSFIIDGVAFDQFCIIKKFYNSKFIDISTYDYLYSYKEIKELFPIYQDLILMRIKNNQFEKLNRILFKNLERLIIKPLAVNESDSDIELGFDCLYHYITPYLNHRQLYNLFLASVED